jgi:hypothetical protein
MICAYFFIDLDLITTSAVDLISSEIYPKEEEEEEKKFYAEKQTMGLILKQKNHLYHCA